MSSGLLPKTCISRWFLWLTLTFGLNLLWEAAQLPFYTLWHEGDSIAIAKAVAHCTAGDVVIAGTIFVAVAMTLRRADWVYMERGNGRALALVLGLAYTAWSEWRNVAAGAWTYSSTMPTIGGIGLMPMLQWSVVPIATWAVLRHISRLWLDRREAKSAREGDVHPAHAGLAVRDLPLAPSKGLDSGL